jgi:NADPH:quinone reductase-like Zn-dependent oxidoreductase
VNLIDYKIATINVDDGNVGGITTYNISGRIVGIGKSIKYFHIGDEVFGVINNKSGEGKRSITKYCVADVEMLIRKPANVSHV